MKYVNYSDHRYYCRINNVPILGTSNFADYEFLKPFICCGWMNFHIDDIIKRGEKYWVIKIIDFHPCAVFVHRTNGQYEQIFLEKGMQIKFDYRKSHGLVPRKLAAEVCERNSINFKKLKIWTKKIDNVLMKPKIVFKFLNA